MDSTMTVSEDSNNSMNKPESLKKTGLGQRLKSAREVLQLTEKEAAARLHLNVNMITLMENENFTEGPPAAFMRGYLRSYARLLNLSENEITLTLKDLESSIPSSNTAVPIVHLQPRKYNERYFHWLTYVIVLVLGVLVSVWWSSHSRYVIGDVPPVQSAITTAQATTAAAPQDSTESAQPPAEVKPAVTPIETPTTLNSATLAPPTSSTLMPSTTLLQPSIPQKAPEPTIAVTPTTPVPAATKFEKTISLSHMGMALPEPGVDNDEDENKNSD